MEGIVSEIGDGRHNLLDGCWVALSIKRQVGGFVKA